MSDSAGSTTDALPAVLRAFFDAVARRDAAALAACFAESGRYHVAVPREPVLGRPAIEATFVRIFGETDRVRWDVVTVVGTGDLYALERVDRFWYAGVEAAMECLGIFELADGLIVAARDYADLATWRTRKADALAPRAGSIDR